jgi:hypothetical protein
MTIKMCELCQSIKKVENLDLEWPTQNRCYETRRYFEEYQPFKKDKKTTVRLTCANFSHIKTAVLSFRGGGQTTIRATPENPKVELEKMGRLFE